MEREVEVEEAVEVGGRVLKIGASLLAVVKEGLADKALLEVEEEEDLMLLLLLEDEAKLDPDPDHELAPPVVAAEEAGLDT